MTGRKRILTLCLLTSAVGILTYIYARRDGLSYRWHMRPIHAVINAGEQCWATEATRLLYANIALTPDRHALADRLLNEPNGSLVAEGMILAVQSGHPRARAILTEHLTDTRWNWSLSLNDDLAAQLLLYLDKKPIENYVSHWLAEMSAINPSTSSPPPLSSPSPPARTSATPN
jgi:hypothetical protein